MQFSIFTLAVATFWVGIFAKVTSLLRRQMFFIKYFSLYPLLIVLFLCVLRLFFSVEMPYTIIINSQTVLPLIQSFLCTSFLQLWSININLVLIIVIVWGLRTASIILKHILDYYRFMRLLDFLPKTNDKRIYDIFSLINAHGRLSKVKIIVHDLVESPAIVGFISPVILLPNINLNDDELLGIFIHETAHYKYCHCFIKCITEIIRAFFWWNPLFKVLSLEIAHALEMQSDKVVCRRINKEQQKKYLAGIAKVAESISSKSPITAFSCSLVEEKNSEKLKQRFKMILGGYYQDGKKSDLLILPIIAVMFLLSYSIVFQPYSLPTLDTFGPMESINSDCYLVKTYNGYNLYDSSHNYVAQITYIDENLKGLKIYKNMEDVE